MGIQEVIYQFIETRLQLKLVNINPEDIEEMKIRYQPENWISDAARRAKQIKLATHIAKGIHPESKGTNINATTSPLPEGLVGSGSLNSLEEDIVGNAAALDVYKFLNLSIDDKTRLFDLVMKEDPRLLVIFASDSQKAASYIQAFKNIAQPEEAHAHAHELMKQILWPVGSDAKKTDTYLNLVPLYPTSFVHHVYQTLQNLRFGDDVKEAKLAKKSKENHVFGYVYFPDVAYLKFGGSKPQNISQKNLERGGRSHLLVSLPPKPKVKTIKFIPSQKSIFDQELNRYTQVAFNELCKYMLKPEAGKQQQDKSRLILNHIMEMVLSYAKIFQQQPKGWSVGSELNHAEQFWLDPKRVLFDSEWAEKHHKIQNDGQNNSKNLHWVIEIEKKFVAWFGQRLKDEHRESLSNFTAAEQKQLLEEFRRVISEANPIKEEALL